MNNPYQNALSSGYNDEQIIESLSKKDPAFKDKYKRALELGYKPEEVFNRAHAKYQQPKEQEAPKEMGVGDYAEDVAKQYAQGVGVGGLGTYGDILDLLGMQPKEMLPGEKQKYEREFDILEKSRKEGPTAGELYELSEGDEIAPRYSRLPSSSEVRKIGEKTGLVTEPKSPAGRYGRRIGQISGSAVAGGGGLKASIAAGAAGQTMEELGAPPWAQAAAEMIAFIKTSPSKARAITSDTPEVQNLITNLRKSGFSEQDITLAKNSLEKRGILKRWAGMTKDAEKAVEESISNSEKLFKSEIGKGLPGYSKGGLPYLEKEANKLYQTMESVAQSIPIKNSAPIRDSLNKSIEYLEKHALDADQRKVVDYLKDALTKVYNANTADFFTDLYRGMNRQGKWLNPGQKEHILRETKDAIMKTFESGSPEVKKFGQFFEKTNESWKKWVDVQDAMELLHKGQKADHFDWKIISKQMQDPENLALFERALGQESAKNIKFITEGADAINNLSKQLTNSKNRSILEGYKTIEALKSVLTGDFKSIAALIGHKFTKDMAAKMLVDPKKQNLIKKIIQSAKDGKSDQAALWARNLQQDIEKDKD